MSAGQEAEAGGERSTHRRPGADAVLLVGVSVLLAVPYLAMSHVDTVDGPAHVLGGAILGPLRGSSAVAHYYHVSFWWVPNALMQYSLAALTLLAGPTWGEKLFVLGYVVGFPLALRFAIRSVDPGAGWLALGALPLTVNRPLLEGFYSFSYGTIGALVAIGIVLRARGRWRAGNGLALAVVLVLVYLEHPLPLVIAVLVIGCLVAADVHLRRTAGADDAGRAPARLLVVPLLATTPAVVMTLWFVLSGNGGGNFARYAGPASLVGGLVSLALPLKAYSGLELVGSVFTAVILVALFVTHRTGRTARSPQRTGLTAGAIGCALVYILVPNDLGVEAIINPRTAIFVPATLLLLLAARGAPGPAWRWAGIGFLAAAVILAAVRLPTELANDGRVTEVLSVERAIPAGATLLEVRVRSFSPLDPLAHLSSRIAADNGDVDLLNLEVPGPDYQERLRPRLVHLTHFLRAGDLSGYARAGGVVDYVVVVGRHGQGRVLATAPGPQFWTQLHDGFDRILVSHSGLVELYRRR